MLFLLFFFLVPSLGKRYANHVTYAAAALYLYFSTIHERKWLSMWLEGEVRA